MTYKGHVQNGKVFLNQSADIPDGTLVEVRVLEANGGSEDIREFLAWAKAVADSIPDEDARQMPADASINLDHYLYGTPKAEP